MASAKTVRIGVASPSRGGQLLMPRSMMKELGIEPGRKRLAFGMKQMTVTVRDLDQREPSDTVLCSSSVVESLHLPVPVSMRLASEGNVLRLGWLFGILAHVRTDGEQVVGQQEPVFRNLLQAAEAVGFCAYVFSPLDLDLEDRSTICYQLEQQRWKRVRLPVPDVVYDQIVSRSFENRPDVAPARAALYHLLGTRYFNPGFFDKWQVHEWLSGDARTASYVPDTICFRSVEQAATFLYSYPDVYMKPVHGSLGVGILRVRRQADGRIVYQLKKQDGVLRQGQAGSISVFLKKYQKRLKKGPYLIQQTLQLRAWQGRPFDIRLLVQKDGSGQWRRTKTFCRIAQEGQITSNLSTGGDALAVKQVLKEILGEDSRVNKVMRELRQIAEDVPAVIEQAQATPLGEIGLDLGLDESGRIWVIEANAKPWKKPNVDEGEWRDLALLAFQRPVQYALYLCKTARDS